MKRIVLSETFQTIALLILLAGWLIKFACVGFEVSQLSRINNYGSLIGILILINLLWLRKTNCNQYFSSAPPPTPVAAVAAAPTSFNAAYLS